jgi:hypothetical protein
MSSRRAPSAPHAAAKRTSRVTNQRSCSSINGTFTLTSHLRVRAVGIGSLTGTRHAAAGPNHRGQSTFVLVLGTFRRIVAYASVQPLQSSITSGHRHGGHSNQHCCLEAAGMRTRAPLYLLQLCPVCGRYVSRALRPFAGLVKLSVRCSMDERENYPPAGRVNRLQLDDIDDENSDYYEQLWNEKLRAREPETSGKYLREESLSAAASATGEPLGAGAQIFRRRQLQRLPVAERAALVADDISRQPEETPSGSSQPFPELYAIPGALWAAWKSFMNAQCGRPRFAASGLSLEALWQTAQRYDFVLALAALLAALQLFGLLGEFVAFAYYIGMPLHRTWRVIASDGSRPRHYERLRQHLCFWNLACMLWAVRFAAVRSILPAWQMLFAALGLGNGVASVCEKALNLGFHLTLNTLMWWQPQSRSPGTVEEYRGAEQLWYQAVHQWIMPRLIRLVERIREQMQRAG